MKGDEFLRAPKIILEINIITFPNSSKSVPKKTSYQSLILDQMEAGRKELPNSLISRFKKPSLH